MAGKYSKKKKKSPIVPILLTIIVLLVLVAGGMLLFRDQINTMLNPPQPTVPTQETVPTTVAPTTVPPTTEPEDDGLPKVVSTASFSVTGDLLMHKPVFNSCWDNTQNTWIFDGIFAQIKEYTEAVDYAIANLETTLCGPDNGYAYSGMPLFNCPDGIADASLNAGFDMLLTGNNHCYDTRIVGIKRTLEVLEQVGLESLGTQANAEDPDHKVIEVNGIKIGVTAYTAQTANQGGAAAYINAIACHPNAIPLINSFSYGALNKFYDEIGLQFEAMKEEGAEAIVVFMHWGEEYQLEPNKYQTQIAQQLCDMGVDVIVGGHPHVIQPMDLLTSTVDETQKTVCIYSLGNAVSNQRIHEMKMKTGHTEDGMLFNFTIAKYSDGNVAVQSVDVIPTWVHMVGMKESYTILPLDDSIRDQWMEKYEIDETTFSYCEASYDRTMALVAPGLEKAQQYCESYNAEILAGLHIPVAETEPTEPPTEATEEATVPATGAGATTETDSTEAAEETTAPVEATTEPTGETTAPTNETTAPTEAVG